MFKKYRPGPVFVDRALIKSPAFLGLSGCSSQVLLLFLARRVMQIVKGNGKRKDSWVILNNGRISFPYREAEKRYGISSKRFTRAIDQLIQHGFIDLAEQGGGLFGKPSLYFISDRWRFFGTEEFESKSRCRVNVEMGYCLKNLKTAVKKGRGTVVKKGCA